jgi:hypothetical protein
MVDVKIDRVDFLEAVERHGAVIRLVRVARVVGLTDTDYQTLQSALDEAGIPAAKAPLTGFPDLVLTERNPKLVEKGVVDVTLVYERITDEGQDLTEPEAGFVSMEVNSYIQQVKTNLDEDGNTITVSHTYPNDDANFPGDTKTQAGEINYFAAHRTMTVTGLKTTSRPWVMAAKMVGAVNSGSWAGGAAHEWMCTGLRWTIHTIGPPVFYSISFEFQHNPDSWNPTVVFIDERTGKPPIGLVEDVGYKTIRKHREISFGSAMGVRLPGT